MAGRTKIGGTAYEISGGKTKIGGTAYSIKGGKTKVGGTAYSIDFIKAAVLNLWSSGNSDTSITCVAYGNGYWVVGGLCYNNSNYKFNAQIAYTTDPAGTWTTKTIVSANNSHAKFTDIAYGNGYWVATVEDGSSSSKNAYIYYATSLSGTWTGVQLWNYSNSNYTSVINCVTYANGYWVVGGEYYSSTYRAKIAYATTPDGKWTTKDLWTGSYYNCRVTCIAYGNGYWVVGGHGYVNGNSQCLNIAYTTDLSGTWTVKSQFWSAKQFTGIAYGNGYWVCCGGPYDSNYNLYAQIAYTTDLSGTWTTKDIWTDRGVLNCIAYADGYWVVGGYGLSDSTFYARTAYATAPTGAWTSKNLWGDTGGTKYAVNGIAYGNGFWVVGGKDYSSSTYYGKMACDNGKPPFTNI